MPARETSLRVATTVMAVACGATVANLYYAQPLLDLIAKDLHVGQGTASLIVTLTQVGYALGLLFLLPVGDLVENRRLVTWVLALSVVALVLAASAPAFLVFAIFSVLVGVASVVAQILVPLAAHLAPPEQRGAVVGRVMSGLLLGILLARTVSSLLADQFGWRAIYYLSAALMLVLVVVLRLLLPSRTPDHQFGYGGLLASLGELVRHEPVLRARALTQATMFGAFTAFWTAIAFELTGQHRLSQLGIAVFALVGAAGAASAPIAGRLADRGHGRAASGVMFVLAAGAMVLAGLGRGSLVLLALGAVLLDVAVQGNQVMGQQEIYALRPDARARVNTVYMVTIFASGAASSAIAGALYSADGWPAVCWFAAALPLLGLLVWAVTLRPGRRPGVVDERSSATPAAVG